MRDRVDMAELDHLVGPETERPAAPARGWAAARQGDQMGLLLAIEHPGPARDGPADQGPLEAAFDEVAADPVDGDRPDIQREADLLIGPSRPRVAAIGLQEDAGPGQLARRRLAFGDEGLQVLALLGGQADDESLVHDRTPSQDPGRSARIGRQSGQLINSWLTGH